MTPRPKWTAMVCDLGGDLRTTRCHVGGGCITLACNVAKHYCDCEPATYMAVVDCPLCRGDGCFDCSDGKVIAP